MRRWRPANQSILPPEPIVDVTRGVPGRWQRRSFGGETTYERLRVGHFAPPPETPRPQP